MDNLTTFMITLQLIKDANSFLGHVMVLGNLLDERIKLIGEKIYGFQVLGKKWTIIIFGLLPIE